MPLTSRTISSLIGGVSQQPAGVRLDYQCEELVNAYPSLTDGLVKRPPTEHIAELGEPGTIEWRNIESFYLTDSAGQFLINMPDLAEGHMIHVTGFANAANNGNFTVLGPPAAGEIDVQQEGGNVIEGPIDATITDLGIMG